MLQATKIIMLNIMKTSSSQLIKIIMLVPHRYDILYEGVGGFCMRGEHRVM